MTTPEIKLIINPQLGNVESIQLLASDKESRAKGFKIIQTLDDEIFRFSERATKLVRLEKAMDRL